MEGAKQAINACLKVTKSDMVLIVTDSQTLDIATSLMQEVKAIDAHIDLLILEDLEERPLRKLPDAVRKGLDNATVSILAAQSKEGEIDSFRRPYLDIIEKKHIRHAHMVGITMEIMEQGMAADYDEIQRFSKKLHGILSTAREIEVTSSQGTNFKAEFGDTPWIISDGQIKKDRWSNLPDGEVWTVPVNCQGRIVIDGILGDHFSQKYGLLEKNPVLLEIVDSRVTRVKCENDNLRVEFEQYIQSDENADRIGEFALGTNRAIKGLIGNLLQDEKYPGVHIAVGHPYPERTGVEWDSKMHCDGVIQNPTVLVHGRKIMENSKYQI